MIFYNFLCGSGALSNEKVQDIAADMVVNFFVHGTLRAPEVLGQVSDVVVESAPALAAF